MTDSELIEIANRLSNADLSRLINLMGDRFCVWVKAPIEIDTVFLVTGASLNGACVQIETD